MPHSQTDDERFIRQSEYSIDFIVDAFERKIAEDGDAQPEEFIPATHKNRDEIVLELLRVDLEHRHAAESYVSLADYRERFPQTLSNLDFLKQLAFDEYVLRCRNGESLQPSEYQERFRIDTQEWPSPTEVLAATTAATRSETPDDGYPLAGSRVLDFQVLAEFGRGAFSRVYLAQEETLAKRLVVLKVSPHFWSEADFLARLQHTNIVPIHSVHRVDEMQVVCMPFWGTCTLGDILREVKDSPEIRSRDWSDAALISTIANHQKATVVSAISDAMVGQQGNGAPSKGPQLSVDDQLADDNKSGQQKSRANGLTSLGVNEPRTDYWKACLHFGIQIADGLSHAHQRDIIHCDLKPANILIADDGRPMILDFNLSVDNRDIKENAVGGTLPYMSPEQLKSLTDDEPDRRPESDIYSLGVILFELLTGEKPFPFRPGAPNSAVARMLIDREVVPSPLALSPNLPHGLSRIVKKCLAFDPTDRYQTADQLRGDLDRQMNDRPLVHVHEPVFERLSKSHRRNPRTAWSVLSLVLFVGMVAVMLSLVQQSRTTSRLATVTTFQEFERDAAWLSSALSLNQIDERERTEIRKQANEWISRLNARDKSEYELHLTAKQSARLDHDVAELLNALSPRKRESPADELLIGDIETPGNYADWARLGNAYARQSDFHRATECFTACIALRPDVAFGYFQRGLAYLDAKEYQSAGEDFQRYSQLRPRSPAGHAYQAKVAMAMKRLPDATAHVQKAIELNPDDAGLQLLKAEIAHAQGNQRVAMDSLKRASSTHTAAEPRSLLASGMAQLRQGKFEDALQTFKAAHQADPTSANAMKNIAYLLSEHLDGLAEAIEWIDRAIAIDPDNAELISSSAVLAARAKKPDEARRRINEALELSDAPATLLRAASVFSLTQKTAQDTDDAIEYTRQALAVAPRWAGFLREDPDLAAIQTDKRFQTLITDATTKLDEP